MLSAGASPREETLYHVIIVVTFFSCVVGFGGVNETAAWHAVTSDFLPL